MSLLCILFIAASACAEPSQTSSSLVGNTVEYEEDILMKKVNKNYPAWYRGCGQGGNGYESDDCALHYYYEYIGPREGGFTPEQGKFVDSDRMYCGTFHMKPGKTYPAHNHPSRELYYIMEGTADWYTGDTKKAVPVKPGTFIHHPPYTPHGWTVTSETPMRAFYCWWVEGEEDLAEKILSKGGRLTNPCRDQSPQTVKAYRDKIAECVDKPAAPAKSEEANCGGTCFGSGEKLTCPGSTCGVDQPEPGCQHGEHDRWGEVKVNCKNDCLNSCLAQNKTNSMYDRVGGEAGYYFEGQQKKQVPKGSSDRYSYEYIGPRDKDAAPETDTFVASDRASCGTLHMKPGAVYPLSTRPVNEFIYIMQGAADWYRGDPDSSEPVAKGSFLHHPPNTQHGWKVTSAIPLKAFYCRWIENDANLNKGLLEQENTLTHP